VKKISLFVLLVVISASLIACNSEEESNANGDTISVGYAINTLDNPFFVDVKEAAEEEAKAKGIQISVVNANEDLSEQMSGIEDLIQKQVDVIILDPVDSEGSSAAVNTANEANIPVITTGRTVDEGEVVTHMGYDEVKNGETAGDYLAEKLNEEGKVVEIQGTPGADTAKMRSEGFNKAMEKYPNIEVVATQSADFDRTKGLDVTEDILQSNSDIDGLYAANDEMGLGALQAIKSANLDGIVIVSNDGTKDAFKAIEEGDLSGTMSVSPQAYGEKAVEIALKVANGEKQEKEIELPSEFISQENLKDALNE